MTRQTGAVRKNHAYYKKPIIIGGPAACDAPCSTQFICEMRCYQYQERAMVVLVAREVGALSLRKQTSNGNYASLTATFDSSPPSDSILLFSAAMAQIKMPKTAFATTSATEYPICSPAVAVTPEMPNILIMYTKG